VTVFALLPLLIVAGVGLAIAGVAILVFSLFREQRRHAAAGGHASFGAYLRAAPRTDEEKRVAADLALKGLVICLLGLLFPPLMLVGLFPFFYGARKLLWAWMGLGFVDDAIEAGPSRPGPGA
jgi:hypothetical protein